MVLTVNTVIRSSYRYFKTSKTPIELEYKLGILCRSDDEYHIRSILHSMMISEGISMVAMKSEDSDTPDRVAVTAHLRMQQGKLANLEQFISRIGLEQSVNAVYWELAA